MRTPQQFIKDLTFEQKAQIIKDFEAFGEDIGDSNSELRRVARQMAKEYDSHVSMWIEMIANMVAHDLAREYVADVSKHAPC